MQLKKENTQKKKYLIVIVVLGWKNISNNLCKSECDPAGQKRKTPFVCQWVWKSKIPLELN